MGRFGGCFGVPGARYLGFVKSPSVLLHVESDPVLPSFSVS